MKNRKMNLLFNLMLCIMFVLTACKKNKTQPQDIQNSQTSVTETTVIADKQDVNQLEVTFLSTSNISFNQQSYTGSIGGQTVTVIVFQNKIGFQVPELTAGTYTFNTSLEGKKISAVYNVAVLPIISNPNTVIQNIQTNSLFSSTSLSQLNSATSNMYGNSNNTTNASVINNYNLNFQNKLNLATAQEKMELAKFITANPDFFKPLMDLTQQIDTFNVNKTTNLINPETQQPITEAEVNKVYKQFITVCMFSVAGGIASGPLLAAAIFAVGVNYIYDSNKALIIQFEKAIFQTGDLNVDAVSRLTTSTYNFNSGKTYNFDISSQYKVLNQQDVNSNSTFIKNLLRVLDNYESAWQKVNSLLPTGLVGGSFHVKNVTTTKTKIWDVDPTYLSITNISNPNVVASVTSANGVLKATFTTNQTIDQNFTFDIEYNNPNVNQNRTNFSGAVIANTGGVGNNNVSIGDTYQGGKVVYILKAGDLGYVSGETHGLITSGLLGYNNPVGTCYTGSTYCRARWGCEGTLINTSTSFGSGMANTIAILNGCPTINTAAYYCYNLIENGYNDWYLPSLDELRKIKSTSAGLSIFTGVEYWSSSQDGPNVAWVIDHGNQAFTIDKSSTADCRAIRSF